MRLKLPKKKLIAVNASLLRRIIAFLIDLLIINFIILRPFRNVLLKLMPGGSFNEAYSYLLSNQNANTALFFITAAISLLALLYFVILQYKLGQTVGMMLLSLHIEPKEIKLWQALVRNLFIIPVFPFFLLWMLDPIYLLFNKEGKRFTERLSNTKIVQVYEVAR
ncbi:RDD family protein [Candidatus Woesearchaeota archaeon]|nr:RDD family protein [Candidatus Woesearchaeota archaeon]